MASDSSSSPLYQHQKKHYEMPNGMDMTDNCHMQTEEVIRLPRQLKQNYLSLFCMSSYLSSVESSRVYGELRIVISIL